MIKTEFNGNFGLDEIKRIVVVCSGVSYYDISLKNDKRHLFMSKLNAFVLEDNSSKSTNELKPGDKIWIDISAFSKDGSLR